jgi:basic membrane protein A
VPEGAEAERAIRDFANKGYDLIFTTSFGFMDPTITVAQEFPDTWFVHISGYKTAPNVSTVFGRQEQAKYLAGMVAGAMTRTNILGLPAAHPIPEVIRLANAFLLGAQATNPNATMKVVWTNSWYDPPLEVEATEALIEADADVIGHDVGTTKNCEVARDKGVWCVGYHTDFCAVANLCDAQLTSSVWNWGAKYTEVARAVKAGTYQTESYYGGLKDKIVDIGPLHKDVPEDVRKLVEEKRRQIESGEWDVFCGPIYDQAGELRVPEGQCMSDEEVLNIDWFVKGVVGELK